MEINHAINGKTENSKFWVTSPGGRPDRFVGGGFFAHLAPEELGGANQRGFLADFQGVFRGRP